MTEVLLDSAQQDLQTLWQMLPRLMAGLGRIAVGMLAAGGVVAVVFRFAFREIGENLLAGLFLSFSRSFEFGDLIQSGDWTGEVKAIALRQVHIRTADGRDIFIPCARVYGNAACRLRTSVVEHGTGIF